MNFFKNFEFSTATNGGFVIRGAQCIKVRTGPLKKCFLKARCRMEKKKHKLRYFKQLAQTYLV